MSRTISNSDFTDQGSEENSNTIPMFSLKNFNKIIKERKRKKELSDFIDQSLEKNPKIAAMYSHKKLKKIDRERKKELRKLKNKNKE